MTTPTFPWQQVAQSCPDAIREFVKYTSQQCHYSVSDLQLETEEFINMQTKYPTPFANTVGHLEAFFDGQRILVACIPKKRKGSFISTISTPAFVYRLFGEGVWDLGFRISASGCEHIFLTRQEAQIAGFVKAFELLEQRLKGGES